MTDHLEDYLRDPPPTMDGDYRDLQRAAFREAVKLSRDVVAPALSQVDAHYDRARREARRRHERAADEVRSRFEADRGEAQRQHEQHVAQLRAKAESSLFSVESERETKRHHVIGNAESREDKARAHCDYVVLMAHSVADAAAKKIQEQRDEVAATVPLARHSLQSLHRQAQALVQLYRQSVSPPKETANTPAGPMDDPGQVFCDQRDLARRYLETLARLSVPGLFVGMRPFVLAGLICTVAVMVMLILSSLRVPFVPAFYVGGPLAGLAALAATLAVGRMLWRRATLQVKGVCEPLYEAIATAQVALVQRVDLAIKRLDERARQTLEDRDQEQHKAKEQFAAAAAEITAGREAALAQIEDAYREARDVIERRRTEDLQRAEEEHRRRQEQLGQRLEFALADIQEQSEREMQGIEEERSAARSRLGRRWKDGWSCLRALVNHTALLDPSLRATWDDPAWTTWTPASTFPTFVRFGSFMLDPSLLADGVFEHAGSPPVDRARLIQVPALLSLSDRGSLLIQTREEGRERAIETLRATMLRLFTAFPPGRVRFTIIDPVGLGRNFAGFMHAADYDESLVGGRIWTDPAHIEQRLADLTDHMENVIQKYLRNEFETIEKYNLQAGELAEPYRFLVIADFPANVTEEAAKRLTSIIASGARCGVHTLIAHDARQELLAGLHLEDLVAGSVHVVHENGRFVWQDAAFGQFPLTLDAPPAEELLTTLVHAVGGAAKDATRVEVPFETVVPADGQYWSADSAEGLTVPIGRTGATRLQRLSLGRGVAQHALIAGKTGSGKSTLLHVITTNLSLWYGPDQVEFYLIDFKRGVEFKTYVTHELPHVRAVAIESDREFGVSILRRLDAEMARRGELFRESGVEGIAAYRRATGIVMPRTVLIVDEFQIFFSEDDRLAQDATILLEQLVRQGRAFGIHVLLGSQTLGGMSGLARSTLGQMAVRVALQCSEADSQLILDDNNVAARLLSRPGEAIYNDAGGMVAGNSPFQTTWLPDTTRDTYLRRVHALAEAGGVHPRPMIVFEGNVPADIRKNDLLAACLANPARPAAAAVPLAWLGEPVIIKDPTSVAFRRQSGANLLIIAQREVPALGVTAAALVSLAGQHEANGARFVIFDGTPADSPQAGTLAALAAALPFDCQLVEWRRVPEVIAELADEVRRRREIELREAPTIYVVVHGLQRYRMLRPVQDAFGLSLDREDANPQPDRQFVEILREGPTVGVHVLAWADTLAAVERTLDRQTLREFDHRVLFQMSASDSSNLIDSPIANQLGFHRAILYSEEQGMLEKFRPYALFDTEWLQQVGSALLKKRR